MGLLEYAIVQLPHGSLNLKRRDEAVRRTAVEPVNIIGRRDGVSTSASGLGNSSTSSLSTTSYAYTTADSAYVDGASTSIFYSTDQSAYVQPAQTTTTSSSDEFQANAANPTAFVNPYSTSSSSSLEVLLDTAATAFVPVTSTVTRNQLVQTSFQPTLASTATSAYVPPSSPTPPSPSPGPDTDEGEDADANQDDSTFDNQNASIEDDGQGNSVLVTQVLDAKRVFLGNYLAVCIAVIYRLLWVVLYSSFNLIEPFRQLMARGGALAESALFAFYQNQSNLLGPIPALMKRRWSLAAVGTAYLVVNFLPALASESVYVDTKWDCPNPDLSNTNNPCNPRIMGNVTVLRVMQGLLCFAAAVILFTTSLLLFNKTGLPTKPNSIATVASLMRHPRLLADLSEMPVDASAEQMQRFMEGKRYRMGHYTCANGLAGYGIQPWNGYDSDGFVSPFGTFKHQYTPVDGSLPFSDRHSQKLRHFQIKDVLLTVFLLGTFGVVLAYYLVGGKSGFNDFFNSNTFGPRFVLTLAGTVIASIWKSVEQGEDLCSNEVTRANRSFRCSSNGTIQPTLQTPILAEQHHPDDTEQYALFVDRADAAQPLLRCQRHHHAYARGGGSECGDLWYPLRQRTDADPVSRVDVHVHRHSWLHDPRHGADLCAEDSRAKDSTEAHDFGSSDELSL